MDRPERLSAVTGWIWLGVFFFLAMFYRESMINSLLGLFGHQ
jgi:hypothetical protein